MEMTNRKMNGNVIMEEETQEQLGLIDKIKNALIFLGLIRDPNKDYTAKELTLSKQVNVRITKSELELFRKYCELRNITMSHFFRELGHREIDRFITENF